MYSVENIIPVSALKLCFLKGVLQKQFWKAQSKILMFYVSSQIESDKAWENKFFWKISMINLTVIFMSFVIKIG